MITVRTNPYKREDYTFFIDVLRSGLAHSCFNFTPCPDAHVCENCRQKISCKELQSAMHFVLAKFYRNESINLNQENKTL